MNSQIEENYLKAIFKLSDGDESNISTSAIAEELDINAASVTDMIKKLATKKLIAYERYQGVRLLSRGRKIAVDIVRKHRLWEVFLVDKLKFNWSEVHDIAEQLEHIRSEELINRLDDFLGNPRVDPHGDPIPDREGNFHASNQMLLRELPPNTEAIINGVKEDSRQLLSYLEQNQLLLGTRITIRKVFDFDGSMILEHPAGKLTISKKVSENLYVNPL